MRVQALPTRYRGIQFRSRLEASWADFFDRHGMKWLYEPEAFDLAGLRYLPDFWLPELRVILEVKGIFDGEANAKVQLLADHAHHHETLVVLAQSHHPPDLALVRPFTSLACGPHGHRGCARGFTDLLLVTCQECDAWYFTHPLHGLRCPRCRRTTSEPIQSHPSQAFPDGTCGQCA